MTGRTLPEALEDAAARATGSVSFQFDDDVVRATTGELLERAKQRASYLAARGLKTGERVGLLGRMSVEWVEWAIAVWCAGGALVPLQFPLRIRAPEVFREGIASRAAAAGCHLVVGGLEFAEFVPEGLLVAWHESADEAARVAQIDPEQPAIIQFTSGSTGSPKAAVISHRATLANTANLDELFELVPGRDLLLSWAPFFHDLGLLSALVWPLVSGFKCVQLPTELFARDPLRWFRLIGESRATITIAPGSAWAAALRRARHDASSFDFSALRFAVLSTETIDPDVVDALDAFGARAGLTRGVVTGAYGLAEFTLVATATRPGAGITIERLDTAALTDGRAVATRSESAKRVASSGRVHGAAEIRIVDAKRRDLADREVGEIFLRGPSLMTGYLGEEPGATFVDGWLPTGDLGYLADGELFVTGRIKDMVIVLGQNYYPEDFEWAASRVAGVRAGRCVAFSATGDEDTLVLVVEPSGEQHPEELAVLVHNEVRDAVAGVPLRVVVAPAGSVLKTTSGKLQRRALKDAYAAGEIPVLASAGAGAT